MHLLNCAGLWLVENLQHQTMHVYAIHSTGYIQSVYGLVNFLKDSMSVIFGTLRWLWSGSAKSSLTTLMKFCRENCENI